MCSGDNLKLGEAIAAKPSWGSNGEQRRMKELLAGTSSSTETALSAVSYILHDMKYHGRCIDIVV